MSEFIRQHLPLSPTCSGPTAARASAAVLTSISASCPRGALPPRRPMGSAWATEPPLGKHFAAHSSTNFNSSICATFSIRTNLSHHPTATTALATFTPATHEDPSWRAGVQCRAAQSVQSHHKAPVVVGCRCTPARLREQASQELHNEGVKRKTRASQ